MTCDHDATDAEIVSRVEGEPGVELEGTCPDCGAPIYAYVELEEH